MNAVSSTLGQGSYATLPPTLTEKLAKWRKQIEEAQRKKCWLIVKSQLDAMDTYYHKDAILNAGKEEAE